MKKITIRNIAKKSITATGRTLLYLLLKTDDLIFELNYPSLCRLMGTEGARQYLNSKSRRLYYPVRSLAKNKLIAIKQQGDKIFVKLTTGGKIAALQIKIAKQRNKLADKNELMLIFDIPEAAKNIRKTFRSSLKRMGFYRIQYSVWGTKYDVVDDLKKYLSSLKISNWVSLYKVRHIK
jgi:hypothetical protein